jgi:hypothetical protein
MLATYLLLVVFTTLIVFGVHAITRPDKLLWFMGVRIHLIDKAARLQEQKSEKLDALYEEYEDKRNEIDKEIDDAQFAVNSYINEHNISSSLSESECPSDLLLLLNKLDEIFRKKEDNKGSLEHRNKLTSRYFDDRIAAIEIRIEKVRKNLFIRVLHYFAPALTECLTCMASFWGGVVLLMHYSDLLYCFAFGVPLAAPLCVLAIAGLNTIIGKITA